MKKIIFAIFIISFSYHIQAQDTIRVRCDTISVVRLLSPAFTYIRIEKKDNCDSVYVVDKQYYLKILREQTACRSFVDLYRFYREQIKAEDQEVGEIIDGYEKIIKVKDDAYNTLIHEYYTLNGLMDSTISKSDQAISISKQSLNSLEGSLNTISASNEQLRNDLKELNKAHNKTKWLFGAGGFAIGLITGFIIAK